MLSKKNHLVYIPSIKSEISLQDYIGKITGLIIFITRVEKNSF